MVDVSKLPGAGKLFRTTYGVGNFKKKLNYLIRAGGSKNLENNIESIVSALKKRETYIRRGGLTRQQQINIRREIGKNSQLSYADKRDLKQILQKLSKNYKEEPIHKSKNVSFNRGENPAEEALQTRFDENSNSRASIVNRQSLGNRRMALRARTTASAIEGSNVGYIGNIIKNKGKISIYGNDENENK